MGQRYLKKGVERKNSEDRMQETGDWKQNLKIPYSLFPIPYSLI